ncbi:helix-turn-helix domain-containing protein [Paenibacillus arenilitoris]|uniref:Helix-turn-helix domain-containing protein n=1 Tax=Paenibacillus arenilitoris TaxID=2772299 RepID=A0A927CRT7_9BACL|nr:helix-turn-helix domain-containing protein [Paenibacillus arenilitoris]MBD2871688.1 helix-turn-helix domain-containing protein [Paenibacillus arenilitoris]
MKKSKTFYNMFIPILVLSMGLVIGFGSYIYLSTIRSVVDSAAESQQNLILQIRNTLEQKIQTIEYAFSTYSTTKSFSDVIASPMTEKEFATYRELNSQLGYIATLGMEGVQYSLISLERNWKISNGSLSRLTEGERDELQEAYVDDLSRSLFWVRTEEGIRFVHTLPVHSKNKTAIAFSDIPMHTLNNMLQAKPDTSVYVISKQGELLYAAEDGKGVLAEEQIRQVSEQAGVPGLPATGEMSISGGLTVLYAKSSYNNWTYVTLLDKSKVSQALKPTLVGLVVMGIVMLLLMVIVAYYLSLYLARPFRKIQKSLPQVAGAAVRDEVDWIIRSIDSIVTEKEQLEQLIELEKPQLETQYVLNLLHNRLTPEEAERGVERFGYPVGPDTRFVTMLIQLDSYDEKYRSDKDVLLLTVSRTVQDLLPASARMLPVVLNERTQATVLLFGKETEQELRKQILHDGKSIIKTTRDYFRFSVSLGISNPYRNLMESREACETSLVALHQRLNLGKESIIFYEDVSTMLPGPVKFHYPSELETQLFDAIRLGDERQVSRYLYPLLAEMVKHSRHPADLEVALVRFVNNLIQLEQLIGGDVLLSQSNANLYHRLLETRNPEEIERILVMEVIQPMVRSMRDKTSQQFRTIADKIAAIIRSEYDLDLSLETISDRLHYSPNYLSSIFKKEYGTTFSEYLMNYRLEIAKKWLVDTEMTIKDIAERLRYQNPQNFIRSFRKKEHVTPGAYRKMKTEQ